MNHWFEPIGSDVVADGDWFYVLISHLHRHEPHYICIKYVNKLLIRHLVHSVHETDVLPIQFMSLPPFCVYKYVYVFVWLFCTAIAAEVSINKINGNSMKNHWKSFEPLWTEINKNVLSVFFLLVLRCFWFGLPFDDIFQCHKMCAIRCVDYSCHSQRIGTLFESMRAVGAFDRAIGATEMKITQNTYTDRKTVAKNIHNQLYACLCVCSKSYFEYFRFVTEPKI